VQTHPYIRIKSGWRKPAVVRVSDMRGKCNHPPLCFPCSPSLAWCRSCARNAITPRDTRSPLQTRFPNHGGLTPAAPGNVRSCITKGVFSPANGRAPIKSGGRQPPVASERTGGTQALLCKRIRISESRAAGVSPPWFECRTCAGNVITPPLCFPCSPSLAWCRSCARNAITPR
jgi:hypothetical protein